MMKHKRILIAAMLALAVLAAYRPGQTAAQSEGAASADEAMAATEAAERAQRAAMRAFYTAPPVIPHDSAELNDRDCYICHVEIRELGTSERTSLETPHSGMASCKQCHLSIEPAFGEPMEAPANTWMGLEQPHGGTRAHPLAPPTIPHRVRLRENCTACHSPESPYESLRSPHPERVSCLQCHLPDGEVEFNVSRGGQDKADDGGES